jgi:hypothetical protein
MRLDWLFGVSAPLKCECGHNRSSHYGGRGDCLVQIDDKYWCACDVYSPVPLGTKTVTETMFPRSD